MKHLILLSLLLTTPFTARAQTGGGANGGKDAEPAWDGAIATLLEFMGDGLVESLGVADKPEVKAAIARSKIVTAETLTPQLKALIARLPRPVFIDEELEIPGRTCVNHVGGGITCHRGRYVAEKERGSYVVTTLHEYLGVLGVETNEGDVSTYAIAKYAANFLSLETRQVWVMRKKQPIPTHSSVTYRHKLIDDLGLKPLPRRYGVDEVYEFMENQETGHRVIITCGVTLESLARAQKNNTKKVKKLIEKLPTGLAVVLSRNVGAEIPENYSGTITLKPGGATQSSKHVVFLWDLFVQKMGQPQFFSNVDHHPLGGCVQHATILKMEETPTGGYGIALGQPKRGDRASLLAAKGVALEEPQPWQLINVGDNMRSNLGCGYDEILKTYKKLDLELFCSFGAYTD